MGETFTTYPPILQLRLLTTRWPRRDVDNTAANVAVAHGQRRTAGCPEGRWPPVLKMDVFVDQRVLRFQKTSKNHREAKETELENWKKQQPMMNCGMAQN